MLVKIALNLGMTGGVAPAPAAPAVGGRRPTTRDVDYLRARRWEARQEAILLAQRAARKALKRAKRAAARLEAVGTPEAREDAVAKAEMASQAVLNLKREVELPPEAQLGAPAARLAQLAHAAQHIIADMTALTRKTERLLREAEEFTVVLAAVFMEE